MHSPMCCHAHQKPKKQDTRKQNKQKTPKTENPTHTKSKHQHKTPSSDVTVTSLWVKKIAQGKG